MLLRVGPWFWDWQLKSAQLSKVGSLSEQFALLEAYQQMSLRYSYWRIIKVQVTAVACPRNQKIHIISVN
jgi:hypothetical protein